MKSFINTIGKSKQFYFTRFFQENIKYLKNMWKRIKKMKSSNNCNHIFPTAITVNNETTSNPFGIANASITILVKLP